MIFFDIFFILNIKGSYNVSNVANLLIIMMVVIQTFKIIENNYFKPLMLIHSLIHCFFPRYLKS